MLPTNIMKILNKDKIANISILGFFSKNDPVKIIKQKGSVAMQGISDEPWWYLSLKNHKDFSWYIENTGSDDRFLAVVDDELLTEVKKRFTCRWILSCQRLYLPEKVKLPRHDIHTEPLTPDDAEHIYNNSDYKQYTSFGYIATQIRNGSGLGVRYNSVLVGWILTHDDGALGMLHVLNEHRRKGIARGLVVEMIKEVTSKGLTPFTYVEPENCPSMSLVKNLGFVEDRMVHWVNMNR